MDISKILSEELKIDEKNVESVVSLLDEGSTVAFIARYRKERTGGLLDNQIRDIESGLQRLRNLQKRQEEVIQAIKNQGKLTSDLEEKILAARTITEVEDLYSPYKSKKKTRADMARDLGLDRLLDFLLNTCQDEEEALKEAEGYLSEEVASPQMALEKSLDILAEEVSNNISAKNIIRQDAYKRGRIFAKEKDDPNLTYEVYYDFSARLKDLKPFQILAIRRGEKEGALEISINFSDDYNKALISKLYPEENSFREELVRRAIDNAYKRLVVPSLSNEIRANLSEYAEDESIKVFSKNLHPYLLQRPIRGKVTMGLDPGFRTGCKVAVVDENGKFLDSGVIYPVKPNERIYEAKKTLARLIKKYDVSLIALGNATASRETEEFLVDFLKELGKDDLSYAIVNEAGASVYSASKLGEEEFPDLDVTIRGAISMARRLQDPMAELVKIDPKHLGIGQYQHDINQKKLDNELKKTVEDAVNEVGVNINNASFTLLSYVSGLNTSLAKRIEEAFKEGEIQERKDLLKVKGLGKKTYQQSAGFLRFPDSPNLLDNTAVHPESYKIAEKLLGRDLDEIDLVKEAEDLEVGLPTLKDIVVELKKPGRDPRDEGPEVFTKSEIMSIEDLKVGDRLRGKVRNVTDFGCFVDLGVGVDGLCHISNMSKDFIRDPNEIVHTSDIIEVTVIDIDKKRQRIGLSMKE